MKDRPPAVQQAIDEAVRIVDVGVDYGAMGIDAPPEVGKRAAEVLEPVADRDEEDLELRCIYSAALSLAGKLDEARAQLGIVVSKDPGYFEAVAELDHPSAWRHVFLSPPWSERSGALPPLVHQAVARWDGLRFVSLREKARRAISLVGRLPPELAAEGDLSQAPAALDVTLLTRTAGVFLALHLGIGGPEPDDVKVVDGFEFPWPEGTGYRSELLARFFLQQDRFYVVLSRPDASVALNRAIVLGPEDRARHERFLRRLESAAPHETDTRAQRTVIGRYFEEFPRSTIRARLAYRLRAGTAPPDLEPEEGPPPRRSLPPGPAKEARASVPPPAGKEGQGARGPAVAAGAAGRTEETGLPGGAAAAARTPTPKYGIPAPVLPPARPAPEPAESAARSTLAVAGLWPWVRRGRLLAHGTPVLLGLTTLAGTAVFLAREQPALAQVVAGGLIGLAAGILAVWTLTVRFENALRRHVERLLAASDGEVTVQSLREAAEKRGPELLPGPWGVRLRRRVLAMLDAGNGPGAPGGGTES
jgi:hypothetical protein